MTQETGFTTDKNGGILSIIFNRPELGNTIPSAAIPAFTDLFTSIAKDPSIRALLIRAEGTTFSSGGDVRNFRQTLATGREERRQEYYDRMDRVVPMVESFMALDLPVITACQGAVAGAGIAFILGADIALADPSVYFVFAHQRLGLTPDGGVSALLPRAVGERKAIELVLSASKIDANEALRIGLVSRIVPAESLQDEALKIARRMAAAPQHVIRQTKRLVNSALHRPLREQMMAERDAVADAVADPDFEEGVTAFLEKRAPKFPSASDS